MSRFEHWRSLLFPRCAAIAPGASRTAVSTIRLGLISEGTNTWPLYAAQGLELFREHGIDVLVTVTGSSVKQQQDLIGGSYDVGFQQADHVVRAVEQGADLFIFAPHGHAPDLTLVAAPGTVDIASLRGREIAVDGARTGYALLLRRLLSQHGLSDSDVVFEEVGGSQERFAALKNGTVAASLLNPPFDANLIAAGYASLARMSEAFPTYPGSVMAARRGWAREHETALLGFIRACDQAYSWLREPGNAADALRMLPERLSIAPRAAASALEQVAHRAKPRISGEGLQQVIDTVWDAEGYRQVKGSPGKYMDLSYLERALASTAA